MISGTPFVHGCSVAGTSVARIVYGSNIYEISAPTCLINNEDEGEANACSRNLMNYPLDKARRALCLSAIPFCQGTALISRLTNLSIYLSILVRDPCNWKKKKKEKKKGEREKKSTRVAPAMKAA